MVLVYRVSTRVTWTCLYGLYNELDLYHIYHLYHHVSLSPLSPLSPSSPLSPLSPSNFIFYHLYHQNLYHLFFVICSTPPPEQTPPELRSSSSETPEFGRLLLRLRPNSGVPAPENLFDVTWNLPESGRSSEESGRSSIGSAPGVRETTCAYMVRGLHKSFRSNI